MGDHTFRGTLNPMWNGDKIPTKTTSPSATTSAREALGRQPSLETTPLDDVRRALSELVFLVLSEMGADDWDLRELELATDRDPLSGEVVRLTIVHLTHRQVATLGQPVFTGEDLSDAALSALVDQVHDVVLEESGGTTAMQCPGHRHPRFPIVRSGRLTWDCPLDQAPPQ